MFTRQSPPIINALWQGGLAPASAAAVQNLTGQCRSPLFHNGPITLDYTQPDMRLITPESATHSYPGGVLPKPEEFPPEPPGDELPPEDGRGRGGFLPPEHLPDPPDQPPGPGEAGFVPQEPRVRDPELTVGRFMYLNQAFNQIGLRTRPSRRHTVFPRNFGDPNTIQSVNFTSNTTLDGASVNRFVGLDIIERSRETQFRVSLTDLSEVEFVADVNLDDADNAVFKIEKAYMFGHEVDVREVTTLRLTLANLCTVLAEAPNYNVAATQVLGHSGDCLEWFDVSDCVSPPP